MNDPVPYSPVPVDEYGGREVSGKWIVVGMFAFAITVVVTLYAYWAMHRGPFLKLQQAIAAEWKGSRPLVHGGQRKMHLNTPRVLRITMEVPFDPNAATHREGVDRIVDRLLVLAEEHQGLDDYEIVEANLFLQEREQKLHKHRVSVTLAGGERVHEDSPQ